MLLRRPAAERGKASFGWLESRHSFSFGDYHDPRHMGFHALRVINEDWVAPGTGFDTHGHRDMEIITYVLGGAVTHKDTLGTEAVIRRGEIQRMSAGTGIRHSEHNRSAAEVLHLLQIWLLPEAPGITPGYQQIAIPPAEMAGRLRLIAARDGGDGVVTVHQDVKLYAARFAEGETVRHGLLPGRHAWVQVTQGAVDVNGVALGEGDGLAVSEEAALAVTGKAAAEVLLFDLA